MLMYKDGEPLRDLRSYYSKDGASQSVEVSPGRGRAGGGRGGTHWEVAGQGD